MALGVAAWLGGCAVGGFDLGGSSSPPPEQTAAPAIVPAIPTGPVAQAPPAQPVVPVAAQASRPVPAGRGARTAAAPPPAAEEDPQPMTVTRARELCWMETEGAKPIRDMDKKIKYVENCVTAKLRSAGQ
jgi:hypothetical protein